MKLIDRLLQRWRIAMAMPHLPDGGRVLDIGCHQGELFEASLDRLKLGIGMDALAVPRAAPRYVLLQQPFQDALPLATGALDAVVMLATLEHILDKDNLAGECHRVLRPGGRVVLTVPDVRVDRIVDILAHLRLIDGMSLQEHHGFQANQTPDIFGRHGFVLETMKSFQLGLNYLYVFRNQL